VALRTVRRTARCRLAAEEIQQVLEARWDLEARQSFAELPSMGDDGLGPRMIFEVAVRSQGPKKLTCQS